jgi:2-polyprenyl-6-methoxyphenol hydroxylase-like FAD-dependent oxidoreductase
MNETPPSPSVAPRVPLRAVIVGSGIGGLTAAIALRRAGMVVTLFERAETLEPVGGGITLAANAMQALTRLGVAERVAELGAPLALGAIRSASGDPIVSAGDELATTVAAAQQSSSDAALWARAGVGVGIHRADLQRALLEHLGGADLHVGQTCVGFEQDAAGVTVRFASGHSARADVLVGADGIRSAVRRSIHGEEPLRYAGSTAYRGIASFPGITESSESWGCGRRFGIVPIGGERVYWFATSNAPAGTVDAPAERRPKLLEAFGGWHEPIEALIEATDAGSIWRHDLFDREPLAAPWGVGRVTLLGDAAHPTTPNLGQGACQAIEDAVVLGDALHAGDDAVAALRSFERRRAPRTAWITRTSWRIGRVAQLDRPALCRVRDALLRVTPAPLRQRQLERVMRFDAAA